jgi:hypothetical protein
MNAAEALLGMSLFVTIAVTVTAIANVWMKRIDAKRAATPSRAVDQRLERIEQAVDVIALEVERISEAQRFAARLAAERTAAVLPPPGRAARGGSITPH